MWIAKGFSSDASVLFYNKILNGVSGELISKITIAQTLTNHVSTYSSVDITTYSLIDIATYSSIDIATYSSIDIATYSLIDIATYSSIDIATYRSVDIATYSSIDIATYSSIIIELMQVTSFTDCGCWLNLQIIN